MLVFMGLAVSFSTLQDTQKSQNKVSTRIWEDPKKGKRFIIMFTIVTAMAIIIGLIGYLSAHDSKLKEVSFGFIVFGMGLVGMLKTMIEMFENHRKDKKE
jgi:protein-S-isoprenylcysteine O-methyltransferase Ste14